MVKRAVVGEKWGRLVITKIVQMGSNLNTVVECICECGAVQPYYFANISSHKTTSCGCFRLENSSLMGKTFGGQSGEKNRKYTIKEANARDLYKKYMARFSGDLTFEDFYKLTQLPCYYCGVEPTQLYKRSSKERMSREPYIYNGLDRLDVKLGYDLSNVVPCCKVCNFMKHTMTSKDFYNQIVKIISNHPLEFNKLGITIGNSNV